MNTTDSKSLLAQYAENGSEAAFGELVSRYINLVYSAAVRLVEGDTHRAEDVAQAVFMDLARQAPTLSQGVMLGGWLHRHTCFVASKTMRSERRRQSRERQAVQMNAEPDHSATHLAQVAPLLDEAINQLGAQDRAAILLRFFEQRDLRSVGEAMGTSENAAQKRVARALEELRGLLGRRGVALGATGLAAALAGEAIVAAPAGLAMSISSAAVAGAAAAGGTGLTLVKLMTMTKLKLGVMGALVVAGAAVPVVVQHQAQARLRDENQFLRHQIADLNQLKAENARLSDQLAEANRSSLAQDQLSELMKLRGEVGLLRKQSNEARRVQAQTRQPKVSPAASAQVPPSADADSEVEPEKQLGIAKLNYARAWVLAFHLYAENNQGRFPANLNQALAYLPEEARTETGLAQGEFPPSGQKFGLTPDRFEIVYSGTLADIPNPASVIVCREKQAWGEVGSWNRAYGFADGHSEIHHSQDGNFEEWERQHLIAPAPPAQ